MATTLYKPIKGRVIRVVKLDACGSAATALNPAAQVVTDGFIKADFTPQYDAGVEFVQKNANGDLCVNEKDADRLKRMEIKLSLCSINPAAIELMTGSRLITQSAIPTGNAMNDQASTANFSLEIWSNLAGQACTTGGTQQYFMWVIPWIQNMKINAVSIDNTPITLELEGNSKANPNYGSRPTNLWSPAGIAATEHWAYQVTSTPPPAITTNTNGYDTLVV